MLAHDVFRLRNGNLPPTQLAGCRDDYTRLRGSQTVQLELIDRYVEEELKLDYLWQDAGWYPCDPVGWSKTGTWEVDKSRYPGGLQAVTDYAHARGIKSILWFEVERINPDTWIIQNHPE